MSSSTVLVRSTVLASSNSNALVSFSAGTKNVAGSLAADSIFFNTSTSVTANSLLRADGTTGTRVKSSGVTINDNNNISSNNVLEGYTTTATAAGTTTLTEASTYMQFFTGSTTQNVDLPVATTLVNGQSWWITNNSTGAVTVRTSGGNTLLVVAAGTEAQVICINTAGGTGTASWKYTYTAHVIASAKKLTVNNTMSFSAADDTGVYTFPTGTKTLVATDVATLSSLTSVGTIGTGTWQGGIISSTYGGTGVNNGGRTLTLNTNSGTIAFSAASKTVTFAKTLTFDGTDSTTMTFPASSATVAGLGITQTFTGINTFTPAARSSGVASYLTITTPADTGQTASTESIGVSFTAATRTWASGTVTLQREHVFAAPTYAGSTSTFTTAVNVDIADPIQGSGATLTNIYSLRAANVLFTGVIKAGSSPITLTNATGNILGAALVGTDITTVGTIGTGTWQGTLVGSTYGGTGVNNAGRTLTISTNSGTIAFAGSSTTMTFPSATDTLSGLGATQTYTGIKTFSPTARSSGVASYLTITMPADTGQTAATESIGVNFTAATRTWADGTTTLQREHVFGAPTYAKTTTSATFTTAVNVDIADPIAGAGVTLTNNYSLRAANVLFTGVIKAGSTPTTLTDSAGKILSAALNTVAVAQGGTGTGSAGITAFNNITGYTASGATGTTSTNIVFSTSPTLVTPVLGTPTSGTLTNCTGYKETFVIAVSDEATSLTTGTAKVKFRMPYAFTITAVRASVTVAPTGSTLIVDINEGGTTIMSTNKLSIDASEYTSTTAATAAGVTDTALADDAEISIDIDQVGATVAGKGLKVYLIGNR
jgi:hypothetical protein